MSSRQPIHIILSFPLYSSSRKMIFINTTPAKKQSYVLNRLSHLKHEHGSSDDIFCRSIIDKYVARPNELEIVCLA